MKIRKFFESEMRLSNDTLSQIMGKILEISENYKSDLKEIQSISDTLSNFISDSESANTQIDDAHLNLQTAMTKITDILQLLSEVDSKLDDYYNSAEKIIYQDEDEDTRFKI